jgi:ATP-independent RNA helicase DbpA
LGYKAMTDIQLRALPPALAGTDLVGKAKTGSGKTAIFGLALLQKIDLAVDNSGGRPQVLVLSPTRELANQLVGSIRSLATSMNGLRVVAVTGGVPSRDQRAGLKVGAHVVVATPGRCLQLLEKGHIDPSAISCLVMDEADTLLDMGFEEEVNQILQFLPPSGDEQTGVHGRQTLLFSATWGGHMEQLSKRVQYFPKMVSDGGSHEDGSAGVTSAAQVDRSRLQQSALLFTGGEYTRLQALSHVLATANAANSTAENGSENGSSCVVFCETRAQCNSVAEFLRHRGASALPLHGDMEQRDRERTLVSFRNKSCRILVATNVASRGLDVEGVSLVVCFELNKEVHAHIHRVGRTARADTFGEAVSLVSTSAAGRGGGEIERLEAIDAFGGEPIARSVWKQPQKHGNGENYDLKKKGWAAEWRTVLVMGGRKDKIRPGDVLGAISNDSVGIQGAQVGKIEVMDKRTWVAVRSSVAAKAAEGLGKTKIKKRKFRVRLID